MNRSKIAQCVAKAQAFVNCGQPQRAEEWLASLLNEFRDSGVNTDEAVSMHRFERSGVPGSGV